MAMRLAELGGTADIRRGGLCWRPADPSAQQNPLEAKKVDAGPALDGKMTPIWQQAAPLSVKLSGGRNLPGGSTDVTLRALYDNEKVYFLAQCRYPPRRRNASPKERRAP